MIRATIRALQRGYGETQRDPESAVAAMLAAEPGLDRDASPPSSTRSTRRSRPARARSGSLRRDVLEAWARWDVEFGILDGAARHRPRVRHLAGRAAAGAEAADLLRADAAELLPHRLAAAPHLHGLDAPGAQLAQHQLAGDPGVVEQLERAVRRRRRGGVPELVGDEDAPVPVVVRVRLGVDLHDERRGVDVAGLVHAQVELEVRPVGRQRVDDLLEGLGERHDVQRNLAVMADPPPPPDPDDPLAPARGLGLDGLLALLERLDGAAESAVVRKALAAGVPRWSWSRRSSARSSGGWSARSGSTMRREW